jgi:hypothetical protein
MWVTWQKAFNAPQPGDTVYFREGVCYHTADKYKRKIII